MMILLIPGILIFGAIVYAIHKGYGVKTMLKWFGATFTFEVQKDVESPEK